LTAANSFVCQPNPPLSDSGSIAGEDISHKFDCAIIIYINKCGSLLPSDDLGRSFGPGSKNSCAATFKGGTMVTMGNDIERIGSNAR